MGARRVAIVTGASSGIGFATASMLAENGYAVYGISRRGKAAPGITPLVCDITDDAAVQRAIGEVISREGCIHLLVNCAGFGISGAFEFTTAEDARRQLDVNVLGTASCIRAVLPHMRAAREGRIINVSSMAAAAPIPFQAWYSMSKAAVSSMTIALHNEVAPYGIEVCAVLPGDVHTGFTAARAKSPAGDREYGGRISRSVTVMEKDEQNGRPPEFIAGHILRLATCRHPRPITVPGTAYKGAWLLLKLLPMRAQRALLSRIYGG